MAKSWLIIGVVLIILLVAGAAYFGPKSEVQPTPTPTTPTPTTPSPTPTPTVTPTTPMNDSAMIDQLLSRFHESFRSRSINETLELFAEDATLTVQLETGALKFSGKNPIGGYYSYLFREAEDPIDIQVLEVSVTLEGSRATARCKIVIDQRNGSEFFELAKIGGTWKISGLTTLFL